MKRVNIKSFFVIAIILFFITGNTYSQKNEVLMPYLKGEVFGYANSKGKIVIEPKYDYVSLFENGFTRVRLGNNWGVIDRNGKVIFEPIAKSILMLDTNGLFILNENNKYGVINTKGKWVVRLEYTRAHIKSNFIEVTNSENKVALLDLNGETILDFKYNGLRFYESSKINSDLIVTQLDNQFGLIEIEENGKVEIRITPQYQSLDKANDQLFKAKLNDKYGLVNSKNEIIVPLEYDNFVKEGQFILAEQKVNFEIKIKTIQSEGFMSAQSRNEIEKEYDDKDKVVYYLLTQERQNEIKSYGIDIRENKEIKILRSLMNSQGKFIIPPQFSEISINKHLIQVKTDDGITLFNKEGNQVSPLLFEQVDEMQEGLILVKIRSEKILTINAHKSIIESDGLIGRENWFKYGFIDTTGNVVIPLNYSGAFAFNLNRAPVKITDKWALMNKNGELITDYKYDQLYYADENRYGFRHGKRWGLMDLEGREIIPAKYYAYRKADYQTDPFGGYSGLVFKNGKALTSKRLPGFLFESITLIDTNGIQLFPFKYMSIEEVEGEMFKVSLRNHGYDSESYGLIDENGKVIVPAYQGAVWWLENEKVFVISKNVFQNKYVYYDRSGQKVESPYKAIEQEGLREYKSLPNGFYSAKYKHYTVYFTPEGIPLFEELKK